MKQKVQKPPRIAEWLLYHTLDRYDRDFVLGDFEEFYTEIRKETGTLNALAWYWFQIFKSIPYFISNFLYWRIVMFKNYLKIAIRNIKKNKGYSFINISGLAIGMACCVLIFLWVHDELSYDQYHKNRDQIFRLTYAEEIGSAYDHYAMAPYAAAAGFTSELPEISSYTRLVRRSGLISFEDKKFDETGIMYADSTFFEIFTHEFIVGDPASALDAPNSIVLTEASAQKIFGNQNPVGKTVHLSSDGELQVTGVIKNVPKNSHFSFNYIVSIRALQKRRPEILNAWLNISGWGYVLLQPGTNPVELEKKFLNIVEKHTEKIAKQYGIKPYFKLQPLTDIHLKSHLQAEIEGNGDINYVYIFSIIAVFILCIACINFMNLSTARSENRRKEVGVRKVLGAYRQGLVQQFLSETAIVSLLALIVAIVIVLCTLPAFNSLTGKEISIEYLNNIVFWSVIIGLLFFTSILAGSYPAFFLSAFQPITVLRGKLNKVSHRSTFRNLLVVFQFSISALLIASTIIVLSQLNFMKNQKLGFKKEQILTVQVRGKTIPQKYEAFKNELLQHSDIYSAAYSNGIPGKTGTILTVKQEGKDQKESHTMSIIFADFAYLKTFGIELTAGRNFSEKFATDTTGGVFLINETAARKLGWGKTTIGKKIGFSTTNLRPIVGIIKDFHYKSLKKMIDPLVINLSTEVEPYLSLKINAENISETIAVVKNKWQTFEKERSFKYFFVDEYFNSLYRVEVQASQLITIFAFIAIFVACLGLFGLASFTTEQRTKEIGIRKVLGALVTKIVLLFSTEFYKWVLLANIFALPVSYFLMKNYWLTNFPYRTNISFWTLISTGVFVLIIAILTVSYQAIKAARANPVQALRHE